MRLIFSCFVVFQNLGIRSWQCVVCTIYDPNLWLFHSIWSCAAAEGDERIVLQTRMFWLQAAKGRALILACSRRSDFVFAPSQFSGPNYLGAWNRLHLLRPLAVIDLWALDIQCGNVKQEFNFADWPLLLYCCSYFLQLQGIFLLFSGVKNNYDSVCLFFHCVVLS